MLTWFSRRPFPTVKRRRVPPPCPRPMLESLERREMLDAGMTGFAVTNLASDLPGVAHHTDANLINPWGFAETPQGQFQVSANGSGDSLRLNARGDTLGQPVVLPTPPGSPPGSTSTPNGAVLNTTNDFVITENGKSAPATFLVSTEDGTIAAFNPQLDPTHAVLFADQSAAGAVYKLLAEAQNQLGNFLFATNFHNGTIDVFNSTGQKVTLNQNGWGTFTDPNAPAGYAPFGIKEVNGIFLVTYAKQDVPGAGHDDVAGPGNGFIDKFDLTGHFLGRFATGTALGGDAPLNSPIGATVAPPGYGPGGKFGGALLVGNFGDSHVSAFDLTTGKFLGQLSDPQGNPLTLNGGVGMPGSKGLWGIGFGNGEGGTNPNTLYFAAGINAEKDGLFGQVTMTDGDHDKDDGPGSSKGGGQQGGGNQGNPQQNTPLGILLADLEAFVQQVLAEIQQIESLIAARMSLMAQMTANMPMMSMNSSPSNGMSAMDSTTPMMTTMNGSSGNGMSDSMGGSSMMMADQLFSNMGGGMMG